MDTPEATPSAAPESESILHDIVVALEQNDSKAVESRFATMQGAEVANILESLPPGKRARAWDCVPENQLGDVLANLREGARLVLIEKLDEADLVAAAETMEIDDLVEVIDEFPQSVSDAILDTLGDDIRDKVETSLTFEEGTAGRLMRSDVITVRPDVRLDTVARYLRLHKPLPSHTDALMVVNREDIFLGVLPIFDVVTNDESALVGDVMRPPTDKVLSNTADKDVARLFERRDLVAIAVVDEFDKLLGRITSEEALALLRREADQALMSRGGLDADEDLFGPILPSAQRRALWLGINLATAFLAAWVIGWFEAALDKIVALAVLMPIVASMGGIAGSQTLTLTIRGLALNQIAGKNIRWLTFKELAVGALNGLAWAVVVGAAAYLWFGSEHLGVVIGVAMIINLLAAAASGVVIPLILHRMGIDPALSGAVVLTTVTDVVGFISFLGLATVFLL